jgi:hypothetical protein
LTPPPHTKHSQKREKRTFPACDSEAYFPAASTVFQGGGDGLGFCGFIFLAMQGQPSKNACESTRPRSPYSGIEPRRFLVRFKNILSLFGPEAAISAQPNLVCPLLHTLPSNTAPHAPRRSPPCIPAMPCGLLQLAQRAMTAALSVL